VSDLAHDVVEGLVDVNAGFRGCLDELAAERPRQRLTLCSLAVSMRFAGGGFGFRWRFLP
jgi:hypothetical protein